MVVVIATAQGTATASPGYATETINAKHTASLPYHSPIITSACNFGWCRSSNRFVFHFVPIFMSIIVVVMRYNVKGREEFKTCGLAVGNVHTYIKLLAYTYPCRQSNEALGA